MSYDRHVCPTCGESVAERYITRHVCMTPDVIERIGVVLRDDSNPGYAISKRMYARVSQAQGLPSVVMLTHRWGSFALACGFFGLAIAPKGPRRQQRDPRPQVRTGMDGPPLPRVHVPDVYELQVCRELVTARTFQRDGQTILHTEVRSMIR